MTLATPPFKVWKAVALALCLAAQTFCSQCYYILLVDCIRVGTWHREHLPRPVGVTEGIEGMLLLSCSVLPVLGTWAGYCQR